MLTGRGILTGGAAIMAIGGAGVMLSARLADDRYTGFAAQLREPLNQSGASRDLIRYATLAANGHNTQPWLSRKSAQAITILPDKMAALADFGA